MVTEGEIVKYEPLNHGRVTYRYTVGGHVYTGADLASPHLVGTHVRVYYAPSDPSVSMRTEPGVSLRSDVVGLCILYAFIAVAGMISAARSPWGELT